MTTHPEPPHGRSLSTQILLATLGILAVTLAFGLLLTAASANARNSDTATREATDIAVSVGSMPGISSALASGDPSGSLAKAGARVKEQTGAAYVVIIDAAGIRYSHPNPALIGQRIEEPVVALDGQVHTGTDVGSLGRSANARVPVLDAQDRPVGEVSVGILESEVTDRFHHELWIVLGYSALALALGVVAALLLAHRIKRVTFGLEPAEIVGLLHEREATLHGIREGVLATNTEGRVTVVNDEARRLLGAPALQVGQAAATTIPPGRLREAVAGRLDEPGSADTTVLTDTHLLTLNRMPVSVDGREIGSVVTVRDRTEIEEVIRQLRETSEISEALRVQAHEFSNRMHVMTMLLELGETDEARAYADQLRSGARVSDDVRDRIGAPVVAALIVAKIAVGAERGVEVGLSARSAMSQRAGSLPLVTVIGNLIDNAIDSASTAPDPRVELSILEHTDSIVITVEDSGPGVPDLLRERVFDDGFSTKAPALDSVSGVRRGVGLALVRRIVTRHHGSVSVTGARFEIVLPLPAAPTDPGGTR